MVQIASDMHGQETIAVFALVPPWRRHGDVAAGLRPSVLDRESHSVGQIFLEKLRRPLQAIDMILLDATKELAKSQQFRQRASTVSRPCGQEESESKNHCASEQVRQDQQAILQS